MTAVGQEIERACAATHRDGGLHNHIVGGHRQVGAAKDIVCGATFKGDGSGVAVKPQIGAAGRDFLGGDIACGVEIQGRRGDAIDLVLLDGHATANGTAKSQGRVGGDAHSTASSIERAIGRVDCQAIASHVDRSAAGIGG